jgi:hypothetical protein
LDSGYFKEPGSQFQLAENLDLSSPNLVPKIRPYLMKSCQTFKKESTQEWELERKRNKEQGPTKSRQAKKSPKEGSH